MDTARDSRSPLSLQEWAAWVAQKMDQIRVESSDERARDIAQVVQVEALHFATYPPRQFLPFVQFQHDMNGKTWPRAWAITTWLWWAKWHYGRKRRHSSGSIR